jgi:ElaB/YqjD/DUF883 family membrane-anchored ribosome-binding protein
MNANETDTNEHVEDHRRWKLAQQIVEDNTSLWHRVLADTKDRPATSVAMAFGLGLIVGLVIARR